MVSIREQLSWDSKEEVADALCELMINTCGCTACPVSAICEKGKNGFEEIIDKSLEEALQIITDAKKGE